MNNKLDLQEIENIKNCINIDNFDKINKDLTIFIRLKINIDKIKDYMFIVNKQELKHKIYNYVNFYDEDINKEYFEEEIKFLDTIQIYTLNEEEKQIYKEIKKYIMNEITLKEKNILIEENYFNSFKPSKENILIVLRKLLADIKKTLKELNDIYNKFILLEDFNMRKLNERKILFFDDKYMKYEFDNNNLDLNNEKYKDMIIQYLTIKNYIKIKMAEFNFLSYHYNILY